MNYCLVNCMQGLKAGVICWVNTVQRLQNQIVKLKFSMALRVSFINPMMMTG